MSLQVVGQIFDGVQIVFDVGGRIERLHRHLGHHCDPPPPPRPLLFAPSNARPAQIVRIVRNVRNASSILAAFTVAALDSAVSRRHRHYRPPTRPHNNTNTPTHARTHTRSCALRSHNGKSKARTGVATIKNYFYLCCAALQTLTSPHPPLSSRCFTSLYFYRRLCRRAR